MATSDTQTASIPSPDGERAASGAQQAAARIQTVGVVGGGLIGLSWAALFLARGLDVIVYDPSEAAEKDVQPFIEAAWTGLAELGLTLQAAPRLPRFTTRMQDLAGADFVQENGPDRIEVKRKIIAAIEAAVRADVPIASSTSSLIASDIQAEAAHPQRILVAHPMNPPHMVPLVELVAGKLTDARFVDLAEAFYQRMQRVTIRVRKEVVGHLANRLTSALYREAVHIAAEGIASVEDIDKAMSYGPGLRWALIGPHMTYHLGGGKGGYRHYLDHLGPTQENRWKELGSPALTEAVKAQLVQGVQEEMKSQDTATLVDRRDAALAAVLKIKKQYGF
ncbi:3-hydroxyacyl-CoA dehydrogenase NAD-binding domain-containing protein [Orrella sp. JC864]|uniref:3-hydroxyacyl-CoA dehydrogenase NAD-binding domain-containing protein n=1 Tax=Orrella sp. JC864 TaxID=3120298 RepID=UPI0030086BCA